MEAVNTSELGEDKGLRSDIWPRFCGIGTKEAEKFKKKEQWEQKYGARKCRVLHGIAGDGHP